MTNKKGLIPNWVILPGIAVVGFWLFQRFKKGQSINPVDWLTPLGSNSNAPFHRIGQQNKIRSDGYGQGRFGASRDGGKRKHNGLDLVVTTGETIYSPIAGKVVRYSNPYPNDSRYTGLHIQNGEYLVKMWYLTPTVKPGQEIDRGQAIGKAQKISTKYGAGMVDHVHIEVWVPNGSGKSVDPAPLFGLG